MLEQEKTRNISLARRLGQLRTAHDALHAKIDEIEQKNEILANEKEELRQEVEDTQRTVRELKGIKAELANDIAVARAMAAGLEHQVAEQSARLKAFTEDNQRYRSHAIEAETRVGTLESELSTVRENLVIVQGENQSLHKSLSQAASEVAALSQRNTEMETALTAATARSQQLENSLYGVETDRNRLVAEVNEVNERQRNVQNKLHAQFEGLQARAAMAEKLLANTRQLLATRSEEARASDRHATEVKRARDAAEIRVREIEAL